MKRIGGLALALAVGGCAALERPAPACPAGQEYLRTAQLFLGRRGAAPYVSDASLQRFVAVEVVPRFPDGVTLMDGGGEWRGSENVLIREAQKVVHIVLPRRGADDQLKAARAAFEREFGADPVLVTQGACVTL